MQTMASFLFVAGENGRDMQIRLSADEDAQVRIEKPQLNSSNMKRTNRGIRNGKFVAVFVMGE